MEATEQKYNTTLNLQEVENHIVEWLAGYATESGTNGFVVGVSGGVDSAVVSTLCAKTGMPVTCVEMPIHQNPDHVSRASNHIQWLYDNYSNVESVTANLSSSFDVFMELNSSNLNGVNSDLAGLAGANTRSRLRMVQLYLIATIKGQLVAGTGNKVEDFGVGFYTKYGDGGVDLSPIADLMKTEVWALASHMGVNDEIINAVPSDGLWEPNSEAGQTDVSDEDQIGASYPELEWAMSCYENGKTPADNDLSDRQREVLRIYNSFNTKNQHKMNEIPVCSVESLR